MNSLKSGQNFFEKVLVDFNVRVFKDIQFNLDCSNYVISDQKLVICIIPKYAHLNRGIPTYIHLLVIVNFRACFGILLTFK